MSDQFNPSKLGTAIQTAREQHFYWFNEACVALDQMRSKVFDLSPDAVKQFEAAKARFEHARRCATVEYKALCLHAGMTNAMNEVARREAAKGNDPISRLLNGGGEGGSTDHLFEDTSPDDSNGGDQ
jgi:hypothetical protein